MTGIAIGTALRLAPAAWWPAGASWAADFIGDRYMLDGTAVPASAAFSFARASTKYAARADGLLVPFAANMPARTDLGLLLEPAATNLCTWSTDYLNAAWVRNGCTATPGQPDPTGGTAASLIQEANSGAMLRRTANFAVTAGQTYTVSRMLKRGNCDWCRLLVGDSTAFTNATWAWFNLATGFVGSVGTNGSGYGYLTHGMTALANGFWQVRLSVVAPGVDLNTGLMTAGGDGLTTRANVGAGAGLGSQVVAWNCQIEIGTTPTSTIVTAATASQRRADEMTILGESGDAIATLSDSTQVALPIVSGIVSPAALPSLAVRTASRS